MATKVIVFRYRNECEVTPGNAPAGRGGQIEWVPANVKEVKLWFPYPELFDPPATNPVSAPETLTIRKDADPGVYEYDVTCDKGPRVEFAEGNSHPRIIVY